MTVAVETTRILYSGSGIVGPYTYPFRIFEDTDLAVITRDPSGTEVTLSLNTHYTVTGAGVEAGGEVTLTTALASGYKLLIMRAMDMLQETDWVENDPFPAASHEDAADKLTMLIQQLNEATSRALQFKKTLTLSNKYLPEPVAETLLGWDASGTEITNYPTTSLTIPVIDHIGNYHDDLAEAVTTIASANKLLLVNKGITVDENLEVPSNIELWVPVQGLITVESGYTLTINNLKAGPYQVFDGDGSVVCGDDWQGDILAAWWKLTKGGVTSNSAALQAALDAMPTDGAEIDVGDGSLAIDVGLVKTTNAGRITIKASGMYATRIIATAAIQMLSLSGSVGSLAGYVTMKNVRWEGNELATGGVKMTHFNYTNFEDVRIEDCVGIGLDISDVEDFQFRNLMVFRCGNYAGQLPAVKLYTSTNYTNSMLFLGGTIERNPYHAVMATQCRKVKFLGTKFHGQTTAEKATPDACDLIVFDNCEESAVIGCQFAQVRRYGISNKQTSGTNDCALVASGNSFSGTQAYTGTDVANIHIDAGLAVIDENIFNGAETGVYTTDGFDIVLTANCDGAVGRNIHMGDPSAYLLKNNDVDKPAPEVIGSTGIGYETIRRIITTVMTANVWEIWKNTKTYPVFSIGVDGELKWGTGAAAQDLVLTRGGANMLKLAVGDFFEIDRLNFRQLTSEPSSPQVGDFVYANAPGWDPGLGDGLYICTANDPSVVWRRISYDAPP